MKAELFVLLIMAVFGSKEYENAENDTKSGEVIEEKNTENSIVVKIEEGEYVKKSTSDYIGVSYAKDNSKWRATRWSTDGKKKVYNGLYANEGTAAHASDTLARKLMENGEQGHKLNFPDDDTEVHREEKKSSKYIGVTFNRSMWHAYRWSKNEKKLIFNGYWENEEKAAHASDTLVREFMEKGEQNLKLNFPDDDTEVHPEEKYTSSKYFGLTYSQKKSKWRVQRRNKNENKMVHGGYYENEETAAHASDTLAREFMEKGEQNLKLNFPNDDTEVHPEEKHNSSKYFGVTSHEKTSRWQAQRWSKHENKMVNNGSFENEETAAHASDTLAREFMEKGEQNLKLNFPNDDTEVHPEKKKTISKYFGVTYIQNRSKWCAYRWSKNENKTLHGGCYDNEETAARASDTLVRKLMEKGEQGHKLNFPDDDTEMRREYLKKKRKRQDDFKDN